VDHSILGYLKRQETYLLELLLESYKTESSQLHGELVEMIRNILNERKAYAPMTVDIEDQNVDSIEKY